MSTSHKFSITSHWLLGFTEGDGSFSYNKLTGRLVFALIQKGNDALMNSIRDYLHNLAQDGNYDHEGGVYIVNYRTIVRLQVEREDFNNQIIIPLFSSVLFKSKKSKDFQD
jgi:hypothetical protein